MLNVSNSRLAALGLVASVGLIGSAHAADFVITTPAIGNFACGAETRTATYQVCSNLDNPILIENIEINTEPGDDFQSNIALVDVNYDASTCKIGSDIEDCCNVVVDINPATLNCFSSTSGTIDRQLEIDFATTGVDPTAPIVSEMTTFGAAQDFVLLGPSVENDINGSAPISIYGDVGFTNPFGTISASILNALTPPSQPFGYNDEITKAAFADLKAAYSVFYNKQFSGCQTIGSTLGGWGNNPGGTGNPLPEGTYCFDPDRSSTATMQGPFNLIGGPDSEFTFIFDFDLEDDIDSVVLWIMDSVQVNLYPVIPGGEPPSADNVNYVINGSLETHASGSFVGNVLSTCGFEAEDDANMSITGRVLVIGEDLISRKSCFKTSDDNSGIIMLNGNSATLPDTFK